MLLSRRQRGVYHAARGWPLKPTLVGGAVLLVLLSVLRAGGVRMPALLSASVTRADSSAVPPLRSPPQSEGQPLQDGVTGSDGAADSVPSRRQRRRRREAQRVAAAAPAPVSPVAAPPPPPPPPPPPSSSPLHKAPLLPPTPPRPPPAAAPAPPKTRGLADIQHAAPWDEPQALGLAATAARVTEADALRCEMPTGVAAPYRLPAQPWAGEWSPAGSSAHLLYSGGGHMEDEYLLHSVKLVGRTLHVHALEYTAGGARQPNSDALPLRRDDPNNALSMGLSVVDSPTPLDCPNGFSDDVWLVMLATSTENVFHQHNDNMLPYWLAVTQMREGAAGAPAGARSVLYLAKTVVNWNMDSGEFWRWALPRAFDELVNENTPAVASGVCLKNLRVGRPRKVFWASFQSVMGFASRNVVRGWADHLMARAGVTYPSKPASWPPRVVLLRRAGSRRFEDEAMLRTAFGEVGITVDGAEMENLSPVQQLELMARTDVLLGVHGAGLTQGLYMRPGSLVVQLVPTNLNYWDTTLFQRFTMLAGLAYYQWDEHDPEYEGVGATGWHKGSVRMSQGDKWCEDVRVFVAQVALVWTREAERATAVRAGAQLLQ